MCGYKYSDINMRHTECGAPMMLATDSTKDGTDQGALPVLFCPTRPLSL